MLVTAGYELADISVEAEVTSTFDVAWEHTHAFTVGTTFLVTAEFQNAGRGRLDRQWHSPAGAGIALTLITDFVSPVSSLAAGVGVIRALRASGVEAQLKWPNDVLIDDAKVGGILLQQRMNRIAIGIGLNVSLTADELPRADATSLTLAGFQIDRTVLTADIVAEVLHELATSTEVILERYVPACSTIGKEVRVTQLSGTNLDGVAVGISATGGLQVLVGTNVHEFSVGDVQHLRVAQ